MMRSRTIMQAACTTMATSTAITAARNSARACGRIELKTGKVQWNFDHVGAGTVTLAGDKLLLIREDGELIVALATPKEFQPISRAQLLPATVRSYPALANGKLYVRNERTLACFDLK